MALTRACASSISLHCFRLGPSFQGSAVFGEWCNGSTTDSGSVSLGSNPSSPAKATPCVAMIYARRCFCAADVLWLGHRPVIVWRAKQACRAPAWRRCQIRSRASSFASALPSGAADFRLAGWGVPLGPQVAIASPRRPGPALGGNQTRARDPPPQNCRWGPWKWAGSNLNPRLTSRPPSKVATVAACSSGVASSRRQGRGYDGCFPPTSRVPHPPIRRCSRPSLHPFALCQ